MPEDGRRAALDRTVPGVIVAGLFGFAPDEFFSAGEHARTTVPAVTF
jgi:hypothetical protein